MAPVQEKDQAYRVNHVYVSATGVYAGGSKGTAF